MGFESSKIVPERIASAAIRLGEDIFTGINHSEAIDHMEERYPRWESMGMKIEDGFITNNDRFVERKVAGQIAKNAGQLSNLSPKLQKDAEEYLHAHFVDDLRPN